MATVRAKFWVTGIRHLHQPSPDQVFAEITLAPVYAGQDGKPANADWSKATPSGEIKMGVTNPAAIEKFTLGQKFYIDFTPAED
mgnify:CR=1 FL=1